MIYNISEDKRMEVLREYLNTKKSIKKIAQEHGISYEDMIEILEEYKSITTDKGSLIRTRKVEVTKKLEEKIYRLRKTGLSYNIIGEKLGISPSTVKKLSKEIFEKRKEVEPSTLKTTNNTTVSKKIRTYKRTDESKEIDEKIYKLREEDLLPFSKISKELEKQGKKITRQAVERRYARTSKLTKKQLVEGILNLIITKRATIEQIKEMAEYYNVNLDELLNNTDEIEK